MEVLPSFPSPAQHLSPAFRNSLPHTSPSSLFFNAHDVAFANAIAATAPHQAAHHFLSSRRRSSPTAISPTYALYHSKACFPPATIPIDTLEHQSGLRAPLAPLDLPTNILWRTHCSKQPHKDMSQEGRQASYVLPCSLFFPIQSNVIGVLMTAL